jgi:predicted XRE-type DNA-binding protein
MASRNVLDRELSSGNVFADLGSAGASRHLINASLVAKIERIITDRELTQAAAAELMGIDQPKVSAMLRGQFRGYSLERLMRVLVALGQDVEIVVQARKRGRAEERSFEWRRR